MEEIAKIAKLPKSPKLNVCVRHKTRGVFYNA